MKFKKLEFRNMNSYGNNIQTIDFPDEVGFFHVCGPTGIGKSTIKNCIEFGSYGKVAEKKLKDLSNRINGSGWVRIRWRVKIKKSL